MKWYLSLLLILVGISGTRCGSGDDAEADNRQPVAGEKCGDIEFICMNDNPLGIIECNNESGIYEIDSCYRRIGVLDGCTGGICDPEHGCVEGNLYDGTDPITSSGRCVNGKSLELPDWEGEPCSKASSWCLIGSPDKSLYYHVVCNAMTSRYEVTLCNGTAPTTMSELVGRCQDPENLCDGQAASE